MAKLRRRIQWHHFAGVALGIALFVSNPPHEAPAPAVVTPTVCMEASS